MTAILSMLGAAVWLATFVGLVARWRYRDRRTADPAWTSKGVRLTTPATYDQARGIARAKAARTASPTGRRYQQANVRPTPVDFLRRKVKP